MGSHTFNFADATAVEIADVEWCSPSHSDLGFTQDAKIPIQITRKAGVPIAVPDGHPVIWQAEITPGSGSDSEGWSTTASYGLLSGPVSFEYKGWNYEARAVFTSLGNLQFLVTKANDDAPNIGQSDSNLSLHIGSGVYRVADSHTANPIWLSAGVTWPVAVNVGLSTSEPGPPGELSATTASDTSVTLGWIAPEQAGGSAITGYAYRRSADSGANWRDWSAIANSATKTSHLVTGLHADTTYTFQLRAANDSGSGLHSGTAEQGPSDTEPSTPTVASVALSDAGADGAYGIGDTVSVTVTFTDSVDVTGMPQLDIDVTGSAKTLTYSSGTTTPALVFKGYVVAENDVDDDGIEIAEDALGLNGGTILQKGSTTVATITHAAVAPESTHRVDGVRPALEGAATSTDGTGIVLTFSEALSATTAEAGAFAVTVNGATASLSGTPAVSGTTVTLTPASAVATGDTVTVAYTDPSADNDANAVQDAAGNDAPTFEAQAVTNRVDLVAPTFVSAATSADGKKVLLTFSEALSATTATATDFTVTVNGSAHGVSSVFAGGLFAARPTVTLVLASAVASGQAVTVAYTDPSANNDANAVQDVAGNDAATFEAQEVTNSVRAGTEGEVLWTVEMTAEVYILHSGDGIFSGTTGWSAGDIGRISGSAQFSYGGTDYTAKQLLFNETVLGGVLFDDGLALGMSPFFPVAPDDLLILALDGTEFQIDEATRSEDAPTYQWGNPGRLTWSDGEPVAVQLIAVSGPKVASVEVLDPPSDNTYAIADTIDLAVTFTQDLTLDVSGGTPELELMVGDSTRTATCPTATGTQLTCRHVVAEGIAGGDRRRGEQAVAERRDAHGPERTERRHGLHGRRGRHRRGPSGGRGAPDVRERGHLDRRHRDRPHLQRGAVLHDGASERVRGDGERSDGVAERRAHGFGDHGDAHAGLGGGHRRHGHGRLHRPELRATTRTRCRTRPATTRRRSKRRR